MEGRIDEYVNRGIGFRVREELTWVMRVLFEKGLINLRGGNASAKLCISGYCFIYITPSGLPKNRLRPDDIAVVDMEGVVHEGVPSTELPLHLEIYRRYRWASAVVHAHTLMTLTASRHGLLDPGLLGYEAKYYLGDCIGRVPPLKPGSSELARAVAAEAGKCRVVVLEGHGAVAVGEGPPIDALHEALDRLIVLEDAARVSIVEALLGGGGCRGKSV